MPSSKGAEIDTPFGLDAKARKMELNSGGSLLLFTSTFSGGGSGTLSALALLAYKSDGRMTNILPKVAVTNQSEYRIWSLPALSPVPVLVTADFYWSKGETHFADHRYSVTGYVFDVQTGRYVERLRYVTTKKHPGLDNADTIMVLEREKAEILRRLADVEGVRRMP
ncbi:MAG TPA: hypothetical protein VIX90_15970 [Edaphobacter sp.]